MDVVINGIIWHVYLTNNQNNLMTSYGQITFGVTDVNNKTIYIYSKLNDYMLNKVLIHELTHAWIFSYNYYLTIDEEEFLCSFIDTYANDILNEADDIISKMIQFNIAR